MRKISNHNLLDIRDKSKHALFVWYLNAGLNTSKRASGLHCRDRKMDELTKLLNIKQTDLELGDEWLGGGMSSAVFKGVWHNNGEIVVVAIKRMKLLEETLSNVCKELRTMQSLPSENICKIYGGCVVEAKKEVWLVMEYADGGDLHEYITKYGPLSKDLQLSFFIQATKAVAALHNAHSPILHRDIKSLNFLVQNGSKLLLTDFGQSKAKALTNPETYTVGTLRWVAPEIVATNKRPWSEKADIFSLGMVFYEIWTGEHPYNDASDENVTQLLNKVKHGNLPKLPPECPKDLATIILRCWNFKADKRPNINELLAMWATVDLTNNKQSPRSETGSIGKKRDKVKVAKETTPSTLSSSSANSSKRLSKDVSVAAKSTYPSEIHPGSPGTPPPDESEMKDVHLLTPTLTVDKHKDGGTILRRSHSDNPAVRTPKTSKLKHETKEKHHNNNNNNEMYESQSSLTVASKMEASNKISSLMNEIQDNLRVSQRLKGKLDTMLRKAKAKSEDKVREVEQSSKYKKRYERYCKAQAELVEAKAYLSQLTEYLWSTGTFETPIAARQRSSSLSSPESEKQVVSQRSSISFTEPNRRHSVKISDAKNSDHSKTKEAERAQNRQANAQLYKQLIQQKYEFEENVGAPFFQHLRSATPTSSIADSSSEDSESDSYNSLEESSPRTGSGNKRLSLLISPPRPASAIA